MSSSLVRHEFVKVKFVKIFIVFCCFCFFFVFVFSFICFNITVQLMIYQLLFNMMESGLIVMVFGNLLQLHVKVSMYHKISHMLI